MKCVKCGAELKEGCIYCSVCGNEAQIVPDYSVLEDDYLRSLLKEENRENEKKTAAPKKTDPKKPPEKKKKSSKTPILVVCCILAAAIITGAAVKLAIDHKNANSYDYQVQMAEKELVDKNYETALGYYKTALSLKPDDLDVRIAMADIYMAQKEYDSAMVLYIEVIGLEPEHREAYKNLIHIYEEKEDYDSIVELASGITDTDLLELFAGYIVAEPVIYPDEGEYDEYMEVTLFSVDGDSIYYTTDGTKPDAKKGTLYDEKKRIRLEEAGEYKIQAICRNEKGIYSEIIEADYVIEVAPPDYPIISPEGGRINGDTLVAMAAGENCSIYYTWDGTDPTEQSLKYETPMEIPTGNNILSVLVVDNKTGLDSGVYRTNFIYYP